ncbi:PrsW family intramembrane metalloprotease [Patescibacteria group bacterium]|nr:PrsW family intramembrane metalloprotease [Patescibacteria group bacterium]
MNLVNYLISEITWRELVLFLFLSGGPTLFWLLLCLRLDRSAPEPRFQIFKTFLLGVMITIPLIFVAGYLTNLVEKSSYISGVFSIFILSFLVDGLLEESAKYGILRQYVVTSLYFDELRDGFIYGMVLGLGFAFVENILYGIITTSIGQGSSTILLRGFTTTLLHFLTGGIIGYYLGLAKFSKDKVSKRKEYFIAFQGIFLAILLHGLYNTIVRFGWWWNLIPLVLLLLITYLVILAKIRRI